MGLWVNIHTINLHSKGIPPICLTTEKWNSNGGDIVVESLLKHKDKLKLVAASKRVNISGLHTGATSFAKLWWTFSERTRQSLFQKEEALPSPRYNFDSQSQFYLFNPQKKKGWVFQVP